MVRFRNLCTLKALSLARNCKTIHIQITQNLAPDIGISKPSMQIMNSIVNDYLEKIVLNAGRLVLHGKKNTLSSTEMSSAIK
ncbi:hypothetical protein K1T71_003210 [Dendrolimus kikuchii]|uniref:Uncharacterized protein n=1 Tax=Dendrolimus kikuchii TaxID=765133 RepID=A0ACC1DB98_9NEOP|nr:hypothetical protein K1T71_003210 [Dendrolimus kikuchii]